MLNKNEGKNRIIEPIKEIDIDIEKEINNKNSLNMYINKMSILKIIQHNKELVNNQRIFPTIELDNKTHKMLKKTYYMNIINSIKKNYEKNKEDSNISKEVYFSLIIDLYKLYNLKELFICKEDYNQCLWLQNAIITILKRYIVNELNSIKNNSSTMDLIDSNDNI